MRKLIMLALITTAFAQVSVTNPTNTAFKPTPANPYYPALAGLRLVIGAGSYINSSTSASVTIPQQTIFLPDNSQNYVYLLTGSGVITSNTTGFPTGSYPIAIAPTSGGQIGALQDVRADVTQGSGTVGVPSAAGAGYFPVSTAAGTSYSGSITPSINGAINQTGITIGSTSYFSEAHGDLSYPGKICGVTAASSYPPSPATGYGYAVIDVCPALFTAPAPTVVGTSSRSIMGINSAVATSFPDVQNVFAINGQLTSPTTYAGNQWSWFGMYHESDWRSSGTLHLSNGIFGANYNSGNGTCTSCIGGHFEAVGNFYNLAVTPTTSYNAGLECNSGVQAGGTHTLDYCFRVLTPFTGGTFSNGHVGIRIEDQTNAGVIPYSNVYALQIGTGNSTQTGQVDLGANTIFIESTGSGAIAIPAPTTALSPSTINIKWPTYAGIMALSPCPTWKVFLSSDFTSANAAGLQAITGLNCALPQLGGIGLNTSFTCEVMYSQATNVAGDQFGVSYTGGITNFNAWASVATNTGAATPFTTATSLAIASNTPTSVITFQPGNTGLNLATIKGTIEPTGGGTFQLYVTNGTAADVIVVKRDSFCQFF